MKQISLNSIRVILEVCVIKNPTCFSRWSVRYSDNNLFTGSVYKRLGFVCNGMTTPDYYWFSKKYGYMSRETCQPKKLIEKYPALYDSSSKSVEKDIMLKLNAKRIYMCGNTRWVLNLR